jgi:hypothetical protein
VFPFCQKVSTANHSNEISESVWHHAMLFSDTYVSNDVYGSTHTDEANVAQHALHNLKDVEPCKLCPPSDNFLLYIPPEIPLTVQCRNRFKSSYHRTLDAMFHLFSAIFQESFNFAK